MHRDRGVEFEQFVAARQAHWLRTAFMLTAQWQSAEDPVQTVMERLYVAWPKVSRQFQARPTGEMPDRYIFPQLKPY